jgi:choline dehydrogenase-like flavoprotein
MGSPGWPIRRSELDAYYDRAAQVIELSFDKLRRQGILDRSRAALNGGLPSFDPGSFVISPPTRFGQKYRGELVQSRNVRLFLECRVIGANFPATAKQSDVAEIESVQVLHANGKQFKVAANRFILATGGIENARVLLGIAEASGGRGNAGGWVGRCFMDHPEITIALALAELPETSIAEFKEHLPDGWENRSLTTLYLSPAAQQRESLPNLSVQMTPVGPQVAPPDVREIFQMFGRLFSPSNSSLLHLRIRLEPRANPENRVVLTDERDKAGIRKTHVSWKLGKDDELACKRAAQLFAEEFSRAARARLKLLVKDDAPWQYVTFASHHVGTTRMGVSSKEGVVDAQGTVFGIPNLCVAGSSVFPAAGVSNPTWTIVALALRLGDRIAESLGGGSK